MLKLRDGIVELYRKVATSIPRDVEDALKQALQREENQSAKGALEIILKNISLARTTSRPMCQDTGFPVFYVRAPRGISHSLIRDSIYEATRVATKKIPLRANSVDIITDKNTGDNTGTLFPYIHILETEDESLEVELMLKGGGSENVGQVYKLPTMLDLGGKSVLAERDLKGVRLCVLDAVLQAQGKACPPYTIGVAVGGSKEQTSYLSKRQLMRRLYDENEDPILKGLEEGLLRDINSLGIGVAGFGGNNTAIGVKVGVASRHPASYFVDVSFSCWALRRGRLVW
ncbi:MAG: fumarate hydratase [Thermodesulfovibrionales bacterium]|nr:fumarate hydratase [Thermodesulfovibrionales bacterium]